MKKEYPEIDILYINYGIDGKVKKVKGCCLAKNVKEQFNKLKIILGLGG